MKKVSIILEYRDKLGYSDQELNQTLQTIVKQNYPNWEVLLVNYKGCDAPYPEIMSDTRIFHLTGNFKNRAHGLNAALKRATGDAVMLVNNVSARVDFRQSTLELFLLVAERNPGLGMIYADYQRVEQNGWATIINLLDHHPGRLRDNMDYGPLLFFPRSVLSAVQGLDAKYEFADLYDLRLKVATAYPVIHIAAKTNGHACVYHAPAKGQNVFDYLLSGQNVQLEMEVVLTEHLKRIKAYLPPDHNYHVVPPAPAKKSATCIASVIIPVFNRKEFIGTAIESVQAQTVSNVEVLVMVNGGPDDPTIEGVKPYLPGGEKYDPHKPAVRLFIEDINNLGLCFNKGLREANGKFYIQLDSDDRLKPDAVEKILAVFDSDPQIGMVIGSYEVWEKAADGKLSRMENIPVVTHGEWTDANGRNNLLRINGAGAPRAAYIHVIQQVGGFGMNDAPYARNYGEDYDLVLRISEQYRIGRVWEPIYEVIRHAGGTDHAIDMATVDRNDNAKDHTRLEAIQRRQKLMAK